MKTHLELFNTEYSRIYESIRKETIGKILEELDKSIKKIPDTSYVDDKQIRKILTRTPYDFTDLLSDCIDPITIEIKEKLLESLNTYKVQIETELLESKSLIQQKPF